MSEAWEKYFAAIEIKDAKSLAEAWYQAMGWKEPLPLEAAAAVEDLIGLCQYAGQTGNPVVHIWTL